MITYKEYKPSISLEKYIKHYYFLEHSDEAFQRITPDGCIELNFSFGSAFERKDNEGNIDIQKDSYTVSRFSQHYFVKPLTTVKLIGICFYPWGVHPFLKVPSHEIVNRQLEQESLFGKEINELNEQVINAKNSDEAIEYIESFLIRNLYSCVNEDALVIDASQQIYISQGNAKLEDVLSNYGLSKRRLEQRFNKSLGVSPKFFSRMVKFQQVIKFLNSATDKVNLTDAAYRFGYYDQSHFIRDFSAFAGVAPKNYLSESHLLNEAMNKSVEKEK